MVQWCLELSLKGLYFRGWGFCLPSERGSTLKGSKFFPFRVDLFWEGDWWTGKQRGSQKVVSLVQKMEENQLCLFSLHKLYPAEFSFDLGLQKGYHNLSTPCFACFSPSLFIIIHVINRLTISGIRHIILRLSKPVHWYITCASELNLWKMREMTCGQVRAVKGPKTLIRNFHCRIRLLEVCF